MRTLKFSVLTTALVAAAIAPVSFFSAKIATAMPVEGAAADAAKTVYPIAVSTPVAQDVETLGANWGKALASRDPQQIVALYDQKAVLLATFSNELDTSTELLDYFVGLTQKEGLNVEFNEQNIRVLDENTASNSGLYTFSYVEGDKTVYVPARYTFLYEKVGDQWLILEHHSSIRPEKAES
jgi:uncharacterized protein (TIGR02246 family)